MHQSFFILGIRRRFFSDYLKSLSNDAGFFKYILNIAIEQVKEIGDE